MKRLLAALGLAFALSGCFTSDGPVFPESRGQCPFETPTQYRSFEEDGEAEPEVITFSTEGAYCVSAEKEDRSRALFVPIGRNWWIVQDADSKKPTYVLMQRRGDRLLQYMPACSDFSERKLAALGVTFDPERKECTVTTPEQVEALFKSWRSPFRKPSGELRREIEK